MNIKKLEKAIALNNQAIALMSKFNEELREHFDTNEIDIFYQTDGWCILFGDANNAPLKDIDMPHLLTLIYDEACEYLTQFSI